MFIGRTDAEAETPILWPPDAKNWLIWKDPYVGKDWRWEEKGMAEDEMVGWHHQINGHKSEWTRELVMTGRPGMLQSMGSQRVDVTEWLNWTELKKMSFSGSKHLIEHFILGEWDSGWNSRSLTLILVHSSVYSFTQMGHSSLPRYKWTSFPHGL